MNDRWVCNVECLLFAAWPLWWVYYLLHLTCQLFSCLRIPNVFAVSVIFIFIFKLSFNFFLFGVSTYDFQLCTLNFEPPKNIIRFFSIFKFFYQYLAFFLRCKLFLPFGIKIIMTELNCLEGVIQQSNGLFNLFYMQTCSKFTRSTLIHRHNIYCVYALITLKWICRIIQMYGNPILNQDQKI